MRYPTDLGVQLFDCINVFLYPNLEKMRKVYEKHISPPSNYNTPISDWRQRKLIHVYKNGVYLKGMYSHDLCLMFNTTLSKLRTRIYGYSNLPYVYQGNRYTFAREDD